MTRTVQMDLLKALVTECLSAAAEEIIRIVQRTIVEHEEDASCPQWTEDKRHGQMDVDEETPSDEQTDDATSDSKPHPSVNHIKLDSDSENSDAPQDCNGPLNVPKPFSCPVCCSGFSSKKAMARHMKKHPEGGASSYHCQHCDKHFCNNSELVAHARIHEGIEMGQSQDGGQSSDQRNSSGSKLAAEEQKQEGDDDDDDEAGQSAMNILPLPAPSYHQTDFDKASLQPLCLFHIHRVSDNDKNAQTLLSADQIKTEPPELGSAIEQNSGLFGAEDAGAESNALMGKSSELILQVEVGTEQKPYKCPCCSKCFSLTKTLLRHMKIHSEDKVYRCRLCGRRFCQKSDLVNHTRVHTGEKPYHCQECHKAFAQKGNLVVHMRTHLVEEPFP